MLDTALSELELLADVSDEQLYYRAYSLAQRYIDSLPPNERKTLVAEIESRIAARSLSNVQLAQPRRIHPGLHRLIYTLSDENLGLDELWFEAKLPNLRALSVGRREHDWGEARSQRWPSLQTVSIAPRAKRVGDVARWLSRQSFPAQRFDATNARLEPVSIAQLIRASWWPTLEHLCLRRNVLNDQTPPWPQMTELHHLDLAWCKAPTAAIRQVLRCLNASVVNHVDLTENTLSGLEQWPDFPEMSWLSLRRCQLGDHDVGVIMQARLPKLRTLLLDDNPFGVEGLSALRLADCLTLETLCLGEFAQADVWSALQQMRWRTLKALAIALSGDAVKWDVGRTPLALSSLRWLDLGHSALSECLSDILDLFPTQQIVSLGLGYCGIDPSELAKMTFPGLERLDLSGNALGDVGLDTLMKAPWWPRLTHLSLVNTGISDVALEHLSEQLPKGLEMLVVSGLRNTISRTAARAFAEAHPHVVTSSSPAQVRAFPV